MGDGRAGRTHGLLGGRAGGSVFAGVVDSRNGWVDGREVRCSVRQLVDRTNGLVSGRWMKDCTSGWVS